MEIGDVLERIKRSAKLKLDWFDLEDSLIEFVGTEKGSLIAENVITEALGELSLGKTKDEVTAGLNAQFLVLSVQTDVGDFVAEVEQKCRVEIDAFVHVRTMNMLGLPTDEICVDLKPKLLSLAVGLSPIGEERQDLQTRIAIGDLYTDPILKYLPRFCWDEPREACQIVSSELKRNIGAYAGIAAALNYLKEH